jgi:type II secretory pathway predicted ATPase ExeA
MYEEFYGFSQRPFSLLPDPGLMYLSKGHRAALDALERTVKQKKRVCLMTGEIGAGKTTLKLKLRDTLTDTCSVGHIPNANDAFDERPSWIVRAFGLEADTGDSDPLLSSLIAFLRQEKKRRKRTALLIDEAQGLSVAAFKALQHLSQAARRKHLPFQLFLFGQKEVRDTLAHPDLKQFARSIDVDYHLNALDYEETRALITHRIQQAGGDPKLFTDAAVEAVFHQSGGIPRIISLLCDTGLVYGYMEASPLINSAIINVVGSDRHNAGLAAGMWQPPQPVVIHKPSARMHDAPARRDQATTSPPVPKTPVTAAPRALATEQNLRARQQRRRARLLDTLTVLLVIVLGVLLWLGREQLFAPASTVASKPPAAGKDSAFASFGTQSE